MQHLHEALSTEDLNGHLDTGAYVAHIFRSPRGGWDAVIDHPEPDIDTSTVVEFLQSVDAAALEEIMLEGSSLGVGPGQAALRALVDLVRRQS